MIRRVRLTDLRVSKMPFQQEGQKLYWDLELTGFGLLVSKSSKSFLYQGRVLGKSIRATIGKFPIISTSEARKAAHKGLSDMSFGINPRAKALDARLKSITLREVAVDFFDSRPLKESTIKGYKQVINTTYKSYLSKPISDITEKVIMNTHKELIRQNKGAYANLVGRVMRSIINFAIGKYKSDGVSIMLFNPVNVLSETRVWGRKIRRTGYLKPYILKDWFCQVDKEANPVVRDYMKFSLFTGLRLSESASLKWSDISLKDRSFVIPDPKNHKPLELPLSDQLYEIISRRKFVSESVFVFPSKRAKSGHIEEPKKNVKAVAESICYHFTMHDLRRTFVTYAESLDISTYAVKALVNHSMSGTDTTGGYIQISVDRLREPMQKISDYIIKCSQN
ncbi:MAG: tyrosine-type recombinase/integrase [Deltaproteobacteria bacterium]|nr:tyrosine-type recombinase/integrase [Deltaproteobacteria bacterium]